ncbi:TauD/TfdA family dioxygenase [Amycolatopsis sp. H6(2020)]|nr:TauD/TfdA family dioxygenase [Amycolatopsis sp. H6(2020)]
MYKVVLDQDEITQVRSLADELAKTCESIEDPEFLRMAPVYAQELPLALRRELHFFRMEELGGALVITGLEIDDHQLGPTPGHWAHRPVPSTSLPADIVFFLCSSLLGDPIGWATQQDGRIMHDVVPSKAHRKEQLGSGSETLLAWHTEDAFHPLRTDYLGLLCLRNPDEVSTTYASIEDLELTAEVQNVLHQRRFPIRPDRSHLPENIGCTKDWDAAAELLLRRSYEWITELNENPDRVAVLFGDEQEPYLRIDPYFMDALDAGADPEAAAALEAIVAEVDRVITGYSLRQGEIIFLDNYRAVHGRRPFKARFDGSDRWLKRLNIVRDLRKSRDRRLSMASRVIH